MKYIYIVMIILLIALTACSQTTNGSNSYSPDGSDVITTQTFQDGELLLSVGPIAGSSASGNLVVEISSVPQNTNQVLIFLKPKNMPATDNPFTAPNTIVQFLEPLSSTITLDTQSVANGEYELTVGASPQSGGSGWLGEIKVDFTISN